MKIKRKLKKYTALFASSIVIATPISALISCDPLLGKLDKYDSENDGKIVIQTTWSAGGNAIDALHEVVNKYNKEETGKPGFMPVKIQHVEGGYGTIPSQVLTKIQSRDTKTLPNLFIDYPSAVGLISPYKMILNMGGNNGLDKNLFEKSFVDVNSKIAGLDPSGFYSIPLAKSTEGLIMDKPLLKYMFTELAKQQGVKLEQGENNPIINGIMNVSGYKDDEPQIKKVWGKITNFKDFNFIGKDNLSGTQFDNVINDKIFSNITSIFKFAHDVQNMFENPGGANMLGLDSPSNTFYNIFSLLNKNNIDDFLFNKGPGKAINYSFLDEKTKSSASFKNIYNEYFKKLIDNNSVWIGGGGAYSSSRLQEHYMAISIGSSAGLNKSYDSKESSNLGRDQVGFLMPPTKIYSKYNKPDDGYDWEKLSSTVQQGPSFNAVHINSEENNSAIRFLKWFYNQDKSFAFGNSNTPETPTTRFAKESSYIVPMKGAFDSNSAIGKIISTPYQNIKNTNLWGVKMSFETLQYELARIKNDPIKNQMLQIPVGTQTGAIRKVIDSKIKASSNSKKSGSSAYSALKIWNDIRMQSIIDGVISGTINRTEYDYPNQLNRNFSDIDWDRYNYVDAVISEWIDGDTPKVKILSVNSKTKALKQIEQNVNEGKSEFSIRISGIDTAEAHVKIGDIKHKVLGSDGKTSFATITDDEMKETIDYYKNKGTPLAVYSNRIYNELNYEKPTKSNGKKNYGFWKNLYVDIQPEMKKIAKDKFNKGIISLDPNDYNLNKGYDPVESDPSNPNAIYDLRNVKIIKNGVKTNLPLVSNIARKEGLWGLIAANYGRATMPIGTHVRIATDGTKSYNRIVGSIFFDSNFNRSKKAIDKPNKKTVGDLYYNTNWSINILRNGYTLPFVGDVSSVSVPKNIMWEIGPGIADAFNLALKSHLGIYDYLNIKTTTTKYDSLNEWLEDVLSTHGLTDYSNLLKLAHSKSTTIYDYLKYRNPHRDSKNIKGANNV